MPIKKVKTGYKYGKMGKTYKNKSGALKQMRAIKGNLNKKIKK